MWTLFWDMHSGGDLKEDHSHIYIEAPEDEACVIFYNRFGHSPHRVTCTCCGSDYSISSEEDLNELTDFHRGSWPSSRPKISLDEYKQSGKALFIRKEDIKPEEREGNIPQQGYVWMD